MPPPEPPMQHALALVFFLALGTVVGAPAAQAAQTWRYVFVNDKLGTPGHQVVEQADDGSFTVSYVYKNNGRGPEQTEHYRVADDGSFSEYHVTGSTTMG